MRLLYILYVHISDVASFIIIVFCFKDNKMADKIV